MVRKALCLLLAFALVSCVLVGCGKSDSDAQGTEVVSASDSAEVYIQP